jgi:hypothetical protein
MIASSLNRCPGLSDVLENQHAEPQSLAAVFELSVRDRYVSPFGVTTQFLLGTVGFELQYCF